MILMTDTVTIWKPNGVGYTRVVVPNCRCEYTRSASTAAVGDNPDPRVTCYFERDPQIEPGAYVSAGEYLEDEPPAEAVRISTVRTYTLGGRFHHVKAQG